MTVMASERKSKIKNFKYVDLFEESKGSQMPSTYWSRNSTDYSALTATQKARRVDK